MKKILFFIMVFLLFMNVNVKASAEVSKNFYEYFEKAYRNHKYTFCVYGDPESKIEEERNHLFIMVDFLKYFAPVNYREEYYKIFGDYEVAENWGIISYYEDFYWTHDINIAAASKHYSSKFDCDDKIYYTCFYDEQVDNTRYTATNLECWWAHYERSLNKVKYNYVGSIEKEPKYNFSGVWVLNKHPEDSLFGEVTTYMSINRNEELTVSASKILTENSKSRLKTKNDKELTVTNADKYLETFVNKNEDSYPRYLVKKSNSNKYEYLNSLSDENNQKIKYDKLYINSRYINVLFQLGNKEKYQYCEDLIGGKDEGFIGFLKGNVFRIIWISVPIILILLTSIDFMKVVFSDNKDGFKDSFKKFAKRVIVSVLIFLTPTIIIFLSNLIVSDEYNVDDCVKSINEISTEINS